MRVVTVSLGDRSYPIRIGRNLLPRLGTFCRPLRLGKRCAVITDRHVAPLYGAAAVDSLQRAGFEPLRLVVPAGEPAKSLDTVQRCYDRLAAHRLERNSFVVALGGGVVGDLAGFVAATYLRGLAFVQVPTTLLGQVDSSVGGKVGVNLKAGKNLVGAFYQPRLVLCDLATLDTLPDREFRAGMAEVIKYGVIYDARLFELLERSLREILTRTPPTLARVVARCCEIKAAVVSQDEREGGLRAILNFGHTVGHAIEAISDYRGFLHGEAISIGQVVAAALSARLTQLPDEERRRLIQLLHDTGLPTSIRLSPAQKRRLLKAMELDKKVQKGEVRFVLARRIGIVEPGHRVPQAFVRQALTPLDP